MSKNELFLRAYLLLFDSNVLLFTKTTKLLLLSNNYANVLAKSISDLLGLGVIENAPKSSV